MNILYIANRVISFLIFCITMLGALWFAGAVGIAGYDALNILMLLLISFYPRNIIKRKYIKIFVLIVIIIWGCVIAYHGIDYFSTKGLIPTYDLIKFVIMLIGCVEVLTKKGTGNPLVSG